MIVELEHLISKLANGAPASSFTARDNELIEALRQHGDVILRQFSSVTSNYKGRNEAGKTKLENLRKALDRICK